MKLIAIWNRSLKTLSLLMPFSCLPFASSYLSSNVGTFVSASHEYEGIRQDNNSVDEIVNLNYANETGNQQILTLNNHDHFYGTTKNYNISFSDVSTPMLFMGTSNEREILYEYRKQARKSETDTFTQICLTATEMGKSPFSSIGGLYSGDEQIGTAFLLSNGFVLTAAHCVYLGGQYWNNLNVRFGYLGANNWEFTSNVWQSYLPTYWTQNCKDSDEHPTLLAHDWAVLQLEDSDLQDDYGACTIASNRDLSSSYYLSVGFPNNKGGKPVVSPGYGIKSQNLSRYETFSFSYFGNSGGPVFQMNHEWNTSIQADTYFDYIVGISSSAYFDSNKVSNMTYNYSGVMRITNPMIQFMEVLPL